MKPIISILAGIFTGLVTSRYLFVNSARGLILWIIFGILLGLWCLNKKEACRIGALYGFFLLFSFMFGGYQGSASEISRILPFAALGLIGAVGGIVLTIVGNYFRPKSL